MEITLSEYATGKKIYAQTYPSNFDERECINETSNEFNGGNYRFRLEEKWFEGVHISVVELDSTADQDFVFHSSQENITFLYCLAGEINFYSTDKKTAILSITKNEQTLSSGQLNNIIFNALSKTRYVYIQITSSFYNKRILDIDFVSNNYLNKKIIDPELELILNAIINHHYEGNAKRLFIEAKIFELIVFYIDQKSNKPSFSLKKEDIDKILKAKWFVEGNIQKPSSLMELSRKVGINDFKLKKGFKELTGLTVFGYLAKIRMEKAYQYLSNDKKTVNEVSFLVGYKNPQHFITAFKKKYGILPGSLNKA